MQEVERRSSMKGTNVDDLLKFNDVDFCKEIDRLCPVLSAALKGALGSKIEEAPSSFAVQTLYYGALFRNR